MDRGGIDRVISKLLSQTGYSHPNLLGSLGSRWF